MQNTLFYLLGITLSWLKVHLLMLKPKNMAFGSTYIDNDPTTLLMFTRYKYKVQVHMLLLYNYLLLSINLLNKYDINVIFTGHG